MLFGNMWADDLGGVYTYGTDGRNEPGQHGPGRSGQQRTF